MAVISLPLAAQGSWARVSPSGTRKALTLCRARVPAARLPDRCETLPPGQDQLPQAGRAGAVQKQEGRLYSRLGLQPVDHQPRAGVPAQGQPQPEPGLVVVRKGGQGYQQRAQEHGQGVSPPRVTRIGQRGQGVGEGAQGLQEGGVVAYNNVGCSVSREVVTSLHKTHGGPLGCARGSLAPVADMDYPYWVVCDIRQICFVSQARQPRTALMHLLHATLRLSRYESSCFKLLRWIRPRAISK